jgi:hypothetical protein
MDYVHIRDNLPANGWERPEGVGEALVCQISGLRPNNVCETRAEMFISLSQAQALPEDTYWQMVEINTQNGKLATINTPDVLRRQQAYFVPPAEAMDWWELNGLALPPTERDTESRPDILTTAEIVRPENWSRVGGVVEIIGSMDANSMDFYQVSYGQNINPVEWFNLTGQETTYSPGTPLATWDTSNLNGTYTLRLLVTNTDRSTETASIQVIVDNVAPSLVLNAGEPGTTYSWPEDEIISLAAAATDNNSIARVEFYHNGVFVGEKQAPPFGYDHQITRAGIEEFKAVAYDAVGNETEASLTVEVTRSGG